MLNKELLRNMVVIMFYCSLTIVQVIVIDWKV